MPSPPLSSKYSYLRSSICSYPNLEFPVVKLPAWGVVVTVIPLDLDPCGLEGADQLLTLVHQGFPLLLSQLGCDAAWDYDHL